jgi:pantothenate kinase
MNIPELAARVAALARHDGARTIIGIVGAPGAGKTTLTEALIRQLNTETSVPEQQRYAHVPMDGFHLSDAELNRLGLLDRKGAPETFDVHGYAATLQRLQTDREYVVYSPGFERELEQPIAGTIPVFPSAQIVLTEGNYLLLDTPEWQRVQEQCTEIWYCEQDNDLRLQRLIERHVRFGKCPTAAEAWVHNVDEPNARRIHATRGKADLIINLDDLIPA